MSLLIGGLNVEIQSLSNIAPAVSIIISTCALIISYLSYTNNRKGTNIVLKKEEKKAIARETTEILILTNETLKAFSNSFYFTNIDQIVVYIIEELYSKDEIILSIKYNELIINDNVIVLNSFINSKEFVDKVRAILFSFWREGENKRSKKRSRSYLSRFEYFGPPIESSINYKMRPEISNFGSLKFNDFFFNLVKLEIRIIDLNRVQYFIDPHDYEFYDLLVENYECILNLLYEAFENQGHEIKLSKSMTPKDIKAAIYRTVNYEQILEKTKFLSSDLRKRGNELKKEITVQYLTD